MALDDAWKPPVGFAPVKGRCPSSGRSITEVGYASIPDPQEEGRQLEFWMGEDQSEIPALPLQERGDLWHTGWDIPTRYVIDAAGATWIDNAHGGFLFLVPPVRFLSKVQDEGTRRRLQRLLRLPVDRPAWVVEALARGWTAPPGWVDPD